MTSSAARLASCPGSRKKRDGRTVLEMTTGDDDELVAESIPLAGLAPVCRISNVCPAA